MILVIFLCADNASAMVRIWSIFLFPLLPRSLNLGAKNRAVAEDPVERSSFPTAHRMPRQRGLANFSLSIGATMNPTVLVVPRSCQREEGVVHREAIRRPKVLVSVNKANTVVSCSSALC